VIESAEPADRPVRAGRPSDTASDALTVAAVVATPLVREGLRAVVRRSGMRWLGAVAGPREALADLRRVRPDVVLVDSATDPLGTLIAELCRPGRVPTVLVLLNEDHPAPDLPRLGRAAGARGVMPLGAHPADLVAVIRRAHRSRLSVAVRAPAVGDVAETSTSADRDDSRLSPRQMEVLEMIAAGMTSVAIAEALVVSPETIRTHVKAVLRRLRASSRTHAVSLAYRKGLLSPDPDHRPLRIPAPCADGPPAGRVRLDEADGPADTDVLVPSTRSA
jgi:DNA-binding NarL/FixJ family response regulator